MASHPDLPKTHRALVLRSTSIPPKVEVGPTPQPGPGSSVIRVLAAGVISYARDIYIGNARKYPFPLPLVPGSSAIGRVVAVGPDATLLESGQLVFFDVTVRSRDNPTDIFLSGLHEGYSKGSKKLMHGEWRDGMYAEYAKVPLENCHVLDEKRLCGNVEDGGLGYSVEELLALSRLLVPYGELADIALKPGETVIVSPATGSFGGAAVQVALAMGARVIAMGRNAEVLKKIASNHERVEAVPITGDVQADMAALKKFGPISAFFDISPPAAQGTTHIKSGILALHHSGRVSLMGGFQEDVPIPHAFVMHCNITIKGKWMYHREDIPVLIKMIELGVLKLGETEGFKVIGKYGLEDWEKAFDSAAENAGIGESTVIVP